MDNENKQENNELQEQDQEPEMVNPSEEEIPLWLQGLEEPEEEPQPLEINQNFEDHWISESADEPLTDHTPPSIDDTEESYGDDQGLPDDFSHFEPELEDNFETEQNIGSEEPAADLESPGDVQDWSDDFSHFEPELEDNFETEQNIGSEEPAADLESPGNDWVEEIIDEAVDEPSQKFTNTANDAPTEPDIEAPIENGFIDLSEIVLLDYDNLEQGSSTKDIAPVEEIPAWLQEMIAETPDVIPEERNITDFGDDFSKDAPTKPVFISQEASSFEFEPEEEWLVEEPVDHFDSPFIFEKDLVKDDQPEIAPESELVSESKEEEIFEDGQVQKMEAAAEQVVEDELTDDLLTAKSLLDQGDYNEALPIFNQYIESSSHLEQIHSWLKDATSNGAKQHCDLWESLGDTEIKMERHPEALYAYAKALKLLMESTGEQDEFS